jgi:hypothetical protein
MSGAKGAAYVSIFAQKMFWNWMMKKRPLRLDIQIVSVANFVNSDARI